MKPVSLKHKQRAPLSLPRWWMLLMMCVSLVLLAGMNIAWTAHVDHERDKFEREADRRWCQLLTTLDSAYTDTPPTTPTGKAVAGAVRDLRSSLQCPPERE